MRVLILGAGGHAQVVADILLCMQKANTGVAPIGYLDDDPLLIGVELLGLPVLGAVDDRSAFAHDAVIAAVGDNATRQRIFQELVSCGELFATARHPNGIVSSSVTVGPGSVICAGVVINPGSVIGANVVLNTGCTVDHHNHIGDHAHIAPGVHLGGEVTVGEGVLVGIGATVMPGRRIGSWSIIGAGSLVHADLPAGAVAVGVPAHIIRQVHEQKAEPHEQAG